MIIGQVLQSVASTTMVYYGPWMPADGNLAVISCEVIATNNLASFQIDVQTKNSEDTDAGAQTPNGGSSNTITLTTETVTKFNVGTKLSDTTGGHLGFEELFRYKYSVAGAEGGSGNGFVHFRMLNPAWLTH